MYFNNIKHKNSCCEKLHFLAFSLYFFILAIIIIKKNACQNILHAIYLNPVDIDTANQFFN